MHWFHIQERSRHSHEAFLYNTPMRSIWTWFTISRSISGSSLRRTWRSTRLLQNHSLGFEFRENGIFRVYCRPRSAENFGEGSSKIHLVELRAELGRDIYIRIGFWRWLQGYRLSGLGRYRCCIPCQQRSAGHELESQASTFGLWHDVLSADISKFHMITHVSTSMGFKHV